MSQLVVLPIYLSTEGALYCYVITLIKRDEKSK